MGYGEHAFIIVAWCIHRQNFRDCVMGSTSALYPTYNMMMTRLIPYLDSLIGFNEQLVGVTE